MRSDTQHYKDAMMQWKERAEQAELESDAARQAMLFNAAEFGELHAAAESRAARMAEALAKERTAIAEYTRYIANQYDAHSDGRNTCVMLAEWIEARAAMRESGTPAKLWRHIRRGSIYREIGRGFAQVTAHPIEEMTAVVIYEHDGKYWVRNAVEFDDGRFEPVMRESGTP